MTLSIILPAYNEEKTIYDILLRLKDIELINGIEKEIIVIDDASIDGTQQKVKDFQHKFPNEHIKYTRQKTNHGKGFAIRTGIQCASGELVIVQDADLEYDPREFNLLLQPIVDGFADVVYGSRFMGGRPHRVLFFFHTIGNNFLTFLSNMFTNINLTDMETCYKMFKSEIIKGISLKENRFGFEPEVTAKVSKIPNVRIYEVGISYYGRTYAEGKKINWKDGLRAIYCIIKYNLFSR